MHACSQFDITLTFSHCFVNDYDEDIRIETAKLRQGSLQSDSFKDSGKKSLDPDQHQN